MTNQFPVTYTGTDWIPLTAALLEGGGSSDHPTDVHGERRDTRPHMRETLSNQIVITRRNYLRTIGVATGVGGLGATAIEPVGAQEGVDPNDPGVLEPILTELTGEEVRIPNTDQVRNGDLNLASNITRADAEGAQSLTGHEITHVADPHDDLDEALENLEDAADDGDRDAMAEAASEIDAILQGTTEGRIYDGFAMLNYNRGAFVDDHVSGEYKMKTLRDTGETATSIDGEQRTVWEVDVAMLWYGGQFDADTFLLRVPVEYHRFDLLRVNYRIYSLVREDFAPTTMMTDVRADRSVRQPFKGLDSVWVDVGTDEILEVTVDHPPLKLLRGVYAWGWREHPPRIHFLQPVFEQENAHTGEVEFEPIGRSFVERNRELSIDRIGDAAPEKKMYEVATAVLDGDASPDEVAEMLTDPDVGPRGTADDWVVLASEQIDLPPEAWDVLTEEGIDEGDFGPYRHVAVFLNNEMYGTGPSDDTIEGWAQGEQFAVKVINLDDHTHYYRVVDFGPRLHDDIENSQSSGSHSFEITNFKPLYGTPKVAEMQWRAG